MGGAQSAPAPPTVPRPSLRPARWRDVRELSALYRERDAADRALFHPLPFGRIPCGATLRTIIAFEPLVRRWVRQLPRQSMRVLAARAGDGGPLVGFGLMRFRRAADGVLVVETGYLVAPAARRHGIGRSLKLAMLSEGYRMGARRAESVILRSNLASQRLNARLGIRMVAPEPGASLPGDGEYVLARLEMDREPTGDPSPPATVPTSGPHTTV